MGGRHVAFVLLFHLLLESASFHLPRGRHHVPRPVDAGTMGSGGEWRPLWGRGADFRWAPLRSLKKWDGMRPMLSTQDQSDQSSEVSRVLNNTAPSMEDDDDDESDDQSFSARVVTFAIKVCLRINA